ncbi:hypothetical protein GCM10009719_04870 [Nocardioides kribbensis]
MVDHALLLGVEARHRGLRVLVHEVVARGGRTVRAGRAGHGPHLSTRRRQPFARPPPTRHHRATARAPGVDSVSRADIRTTLSGAPR